MKNLTSAEKKVASLIQQDIQVVSRPFREAGMAGGLSEEEVLKTTERLIKDGYIRRFGAILRHQQAGYTRNALVVWAVPPDQLEAAGKILGTSSFISHCYERKPAFQNKYNLFSMLHTRHKNLETIIAQLAQTIDCQDFLMLESLQEYKKVSPEYFPHD
jgi:siroheme decarboxylase